MTDRKYQDGDGNDCTLEQMVRREPEWAASRIRAGEAAIAERDRLRAALREAIEWNGEDDCGVPAVWLQRARAALEPRK